MDPVVTDASHGAGSGFRSTAGPFPFRVAPGSGPGEFRPFHSAGAAGEFRSEAPEAKRFNIADLFEFRRRRGDLVFSLAMLLGVLVLLWQFGSESGWNDRDLAQKRVGKILKQPWVGPFMAMALLLPAAVLNAWSSWQKTRRDARLRRPDRTRYELGQWARSFEFIAYFIAYTAIIPILGYLVSTLLFTVFLTWRLGYRSRRWIAISLGSAFAVVIVFRTLLQIKTPVNIWLYGQLPPGAESFMKIYF
ncbi:MAG: tripartite tricarboxylate transporter TctB family protein [Paracoccaceae bacterium]|nr:tripartite tricarboxylate transporter TctB family protein [Paracoccaceae bacterium]